MMKELNVIRLSSITTWVEGGLGLTICVVYLFLYVCSISVDNITEDSESESTSVDQVMAGIYSYYIASGDCVYKDGQNATSNNPNSLTKPNVIFIIQTVYLVIYILWLFSSTLLFKASSSMRSFYLSPWLVCVSCLTVVDVVAAALIFTDLAVDRDKDYDNSSDDLPWMVATMVGYFTRGGLGLVFNVVVAVLVLRFMLDKTGPGPGSSYKDESLNNYWTDKGFNDIRRELSRRGQEDFMANQLPDASSSNPNTLRQHNEFSSGETNDGFLGDTNLQQGAGQGAAGRAGWSTHAQPDQGQQQYIRPPSFKERVREAKEAKTAVGAGGMFRYSMDTAHLRQKAARPKHDLENSFNFLSEYEDGAGGQERTNTSLAPSHQLPGHRDANDDGHFLIPRVKVPISRSSSLLQSQDSHQMKDPVTKYFIPLKE